MSSGERNFYHVKGWASKGAVELDRVTDSYKRAMKEASTMKKGFGPEEGNRVRISRNGEAVAAWAGSKQGKWLRVTVSEREEWR